MLCYLAGMEPYYLECIKDGPFQPKIAKGDDKSESQLTLDERRVVVQDQRLKSIIMSCLSDDVMESVISYETAKETWTDLVHSFEGPLDTKENRIMDLKLEYQTFRAKPLSQTYTRYKTLLNDDVNLSKQEINVGFVNMTGYSSVSKGFQTNFTSKLIQSSSNSNSQVDPKFQKDYKAEYKKMKAKLALLEAKVFDEEEVTQVKVLMDLADDELTVGKSHARNGEWVDITIRKRLNPDIKLPKFNTGRIIVPKSQAVNESLEPTKTLDTPESSKDSEAESLTPLPPLKNLQGASPSLEDSLLHDMQKRDHRTLDHEMSIALLKKSENYKAQPYQYASSSKKILKAKAKPFSPCTHYGFNDHRPDDCRNTRCEITIGSYDH
ncbi:hypothetical protein Tco_0866063 [Tanacetum coccineum]